MKTGYKKKKPLFPPPKAKRARPKRKAKKDLSKCSLADFVKPEGPEKETEDFYHDDTPSSLPPEGGPSAPLEKGVGLHIRHFSEGMDEAAFGVKKALEATENLPKGRKLAKVHKALTEGVIPWLEVADDAFVEAYPEADDEKEDKG